MERGNNIKVYLFYWLPVLIYCYIIFYLSSRERIPLIPSISHIDKVFHMIEYGILSILLVRAFQRVLTYKKIILLVAIIFAILYGISDEIHQSFVSYRTSDIYDAIFDALGAIVAGQGYYLLSQRKKSEIRLSRRYE
ncbi:MAG: VanZ family protein [Nitrospinae bacterium]|nr:VanZ family protein [Nitrospinota bacterium]